MNRTFLHRSTVGDMALLLIVAASCSNPDATLAKKGTLIVSAAASTKEVMEALAAEFKQQSAADVQVNPGASSALAGQILAGAPADLFLSASRQWADEVEKEGQTVAAAPLLTNRLVLIVPKGNPAQVREPKDLLSEKVKQIALASEKVPAGMYADQALAKLELLTRLVEAGKVVRGQDVRTALAYVERGEAEAGIVYSTDVGLSPQVASAYEFDPKLHDEITYMLVLLKHGGQNPAARGFYDFLQSAAADKVYEKFGFTRLRTPSP